MLLVIMGIRLMTEKKIAHYLAMRHWNGRHLCMIRNCHAAGGHESDLLVVNEKLRVIDVEIKISKADFKADQKKGKWKRHIGEHQIKDVDDAIETSRKVEYRGRSREIKSWHEKLLYPQKVWKHYFCMPASIWDDSMLDDLASPESGVMLVEQHEGRITGIRTIKQAKANPNYKFLNINEVKNLARLCTLRMWSIMEKENV